MLNSFKAWVIAKPKKLEKPQLSLKNDLMNKKP
jgi:hypothetical protein